jgi:benzoyl-CoA reductase/2-hydroxyglutaryl-CoA dehydratase subunit BcrC/BadD/HgdB
MTKDELIAQFKIDYPTLQTGNDEIGYTEMQTPEYEATLEKWADNAILEESLRAEKQAARDAAEAKLSALGLTADDLQALGL